MLDALLQVLAVFATVVFGLTLFRERGQHPERLGLALLAVVVLALAVDWPAHAAAGMLLGVLFPLAFSRRLNPWPMLTLLACALVLAVVEAGWVIIPAAVAGGLWLLAGNGWRALSTLLGPTSADLPATPPEALPEHTGGLTVPQAQATADPVPVGRASAAPQATAQAAHAPVPDALSQLHFETRLPAEARAQLVALDSLSAEALQTVQQGGYNPQAAYHLRAIRNEYAPNVVQAYLRLPAALADVTPLEGQKTGRDLLTEQLELLISATRDILNHSALTSSQELLSNGRFLHDKFGPGNRDLDV